MIDVAEYLTKKGFTYTAVDRNGVLNYVMNCPICHETEKKFAVRADDGAYNCLHLKTCGAKGSFTDLQRTLGDIPERLNKPNFIAPVKKTYKKVEEHASKLSKPVLDYLHERGFSDKTIAYFKLGQKDNNTVMMPYFKDGILANVKYRDLHDKKKMWHPPGAEPLLFNRDNVPLGEELIIVEGEYDCIAMQEYGIPCVSVPNGVGNDNWIEHEEEWLKQFTRINIMMDNDVPGQKHAGELSLRLGRYRCYNVLTPKKDANECLNNGISSEHILRCIENAVDYKNPIVKSVGDFIEPMLNRDVVAEQGFQTPFTKLNTMMKGFRQNELTIISGSNGSGKSTLISQLIGNIVNQKGRVCLASLEMAPEDYLEWLVTQNSWHGSMEESDIKAILENMDPFLYVVDTEEELTPELLFDAWEYAARKYGIKVFILDSLMRISFPGIKELAEQKAFTSKIIAFTKNYKCHVLMVAHPRKLKYDSDIPGKVDISGSGDITNLAHNVITVWRTPEKDKESAKEEEKTIADTIIFLRKNRKYGTEGSVRLEFNTQTKLFKEIR